MSHKRQDVAKNCKSLAAKLQDVNFFREDSREGNRSAPSKSHVAL